MRRLFLLMIFICMTLPAFATTRYVKPTSPGNDSNSCSASTSSSTPKQHLKGGSGALACMSAGDTLILMDGTYDEQLINVIPFGTNGSPIILQAQNRNQAIIRPQTGFSNGFGVVYINDSSDGHDITLDGLYIDCHYCDRGSYVMLMPGARMTIKNGTIQGASAVDAFGVSSVGIQVGPTSGQTSGEALIQNNDITNTWSHGIYASIGNSTIENNRISNCGTTSGDTHSTAFGIQLYHGTTAISNTVLRNNTITNCYNGMVIANNSGGSGHKAYNNLINGGPGDGVQIRYSCTSCSFQFNTVYGMTGSSFIIKNDGTTSTVQDNIFYANGNNAGTDETGGSGQTISNNRVGGTDPFVTAGSNFHLAADDNGGVTIGGITTDFDGISRSSPPDRGLYEFVSGCAANRLKFTNQPAATVNPGQTLGTVQVSVMCSDNTTVVTSSSASIVMALNAACQVGQVLNGTITQSASAGVASFSDLSITGALGSCFLDASSSGLTGATSTSFQVVSPAAQAAKGRVRGRGRRR